MEKAVPVGLCLADCHLGIGHVQVVDNPFHKAEETITVFFTV